MIWTQSYETFNNGHGFLDSVSVDELISSGRGMKVAVKDDLVTGKDYTGELASGTSLLLGQYKIDRFINSGGFGITYLAKDSLDRAIVIKECFPTSIVCREETKVRAVSRSADKNFKSIVSLFVDEARRLSKLKHPNIVGVHQIFEDNETAYMALDFVDGKDLYDIFEQNPERLSAETVPKMLLKLLSAVAFIHDHGILHRDIAPDNILLDQDGNPILIDFGAARERVAQSNNPLSALLVVKDGYSPPEFYTSEAEQGPFSDIYCLAATFYHLITGAAPPNSMERAEAIKANKPDPYKSILNCGDNYEPEFLVAIDRALAISASERLQSADDWILAIDKNKRRDVAIARAAGDKTTETTISKLVNETNQKVREEIALSEKIQVETKTKIKQAHDEAIAAKLKLQQEIDTDEVRHEIEQDLLEDEAAQVDIETIESVIDDAPRRWKFMGSPEKRPGRRFWDLG